MTEETLSKVKPTKSDVQRHQVNPIFYTKARNFPMQHFNPWEQGRLGKPPRLYRCQQVIGHPPGKVAL